jgi:hypothetical protein
MQNHTGRQKNSALKPPSGAVVAMKYDIDSKYLDKRHHYAASNIYDLALVTLNHVPASWQGSKYTPDWP